MRAQHHGVHACRVRCLGAGGMVPQQETNEVHERDKAVTDGVEDDRTLWVSEALDIDEESEKSEECGAQTDDGTHADEALGKFNVVGFEVHVGAGGSAVLGTQEQ